MPILENILIYALLVFISFIIYFAILYLSTLSWYEREEKAGSAWRIGTILSLVWTVVVSIPLFFNITVIIEVYYEYSLVAFILALIVLYPFITWVRKNMTTHFYIAAFVSYNVLMWFVFAPFLFFVLNMDYVQIIIAGYLIGALLGTPLAVAIIKELRPKEIILGGLPAITTAITVADFGSKILSSSLPPLLDTGVFVVTWVHVFFIASLILQTLYYRFSIKG